MHHCLHAVMLAWLGDVVSAAPSQGMSLEPLETELAIAWRCRTRSSRRDHPDETDIDPEIIC